MCELAPSELAGLVPLVLRPTPDNMDELLAKLETFAAGMKGIQAQVLDRGFCDNQTADTVRRLQNEMAQTQRLLGSAAAFYAGLARLRSAHNQSYDGAGLLHSSSNTGRVLAQL